MGKFWQGKMLVNELHVQLQLIINVTLKIGEWYSIHQLQNFSCMVLLISTFQGWQNQSDWSSFYRTTFSWRFKILLNKDGILNLGILR